MRRAEVHCRKPQLEYWGTLVPDTYKSKLQVFTFPQKQQERGLFPFCLFAFLFFFHRAEFPHKIIEKPSDSNPENKQKERPFSVSLKIQQSPSVGGLRKAASLAPTPIADQPERARPRRAKGTSGCSSHSALGLEQFLLLTLFHQRL